MKTITKDIVITVMVKLVLLFLLWYFCVREMHPELSSSKEWFLGKNEPAELNSINKR
ncbi:cytochrome oxidase putative small subunit CydP [Legionella waltersii]|uniref:Uncharacterized protein n=1 Tax=Legionella waltersii TaxID=66969 RepID=A0A0W1AMV6_9GAMM|nr:cytochrome oxidase putative small subunit CydP [Legionella waltersii]KTD82693.1 hypothetical protein Lwal_0435 [Legionella waltersii]SNV03334.1 Uncharacterised protein [Legionella waltersii]